MKVLRDLRRTILAATTDADRHEIREYVLALLREVADLATV